MDTPIDTFAIFHRTLHTNKTFTPEDPYTRNRLHQRIYTRSFYTRKPFYIHQKSITQQTACTCTKRTSKGNLSQKPFKPKTLTAETSYTKTLTPQRALHQTSSFTPECFYTRQLLAPEGLPQPRNRKFTSSANFSGFFLPSKRSLC